MLHNQLLGKVGSGRELPVTAFRAVLGQVPVWLHPTSWAPSMAVHAEPFAYTVLGPQPTKWSLFAIPLFRWRQAGEGPTPGGLPVDKRLRVLWVLLTPQGNHGTL